MLGGRFVPRRFLAGPGARDRADVGERRLWLGSGAERGWPGLSVFWFVGGTDPDVYAKAKAAGRVNEIPSNHNPRFAPVLHPTLRTGVEALIVAARGWLDSG